jgi:exodeoxyribonuclease-5
VETDSQPEVETNITSRALEESDLSADQVAVYEPLKKWVFKGTLVPGQQNPLLLTMGGFAGCGKTSLLSILARNLGKIRAAFCALTGKAAGVLRKKLRAVGFNTSGDNYCGTIHGLIYAPIQDKRTGRVYYSKKTSLDYDVIVVDESSMISKDIYEDLAEYGLPILAVGDHGQLEPMSKGFNLMEHPLLRLEKIHRQAEDNPIIRLAEVIRKTGKIHRELADGVFVRIAAKAGLKEELRRLFDKDKPVESLFDQAVLTYTNYARTRINSMVRHFRFGSSPELPQKYDQVICLRNARVGGRDGPKVFNGMRGYMRADSVVLETNRNLQKAKILFPDEELTISENVSRWQFGREKTFSNFQDLHVHGLHPKHWNEVGMLIDYGYCLTTHKAQGSQFSDVVVCYERPSIVDDEGFRRWLYTSVSRSSDKLVILM